MCDNCPLETVKIQDGLIYEIHVTVFLLDNRTLERAKAGETEGGYRILEIGNHYSDAHTKWILDLFTTSHVKGQDIDAFVEMNRVANFLRKIPGVRVVREKIETVPWHPLCPNSDTAFGLRDYQYFEAHLQLPSYVPPSVLQEAGLLVSRNLNKPGKVMGTLRRDGCRLIEFKMELAHLIKNLPVKPEKEIIEFTLYDSNREHDKGWENQ